MMSDGTENMVAEQEDEKAASKRKTLSLGERIKVVDYLRARVEPIVADSNMAIAAVVSDATQVEINWQQLKYMIDDPTLADMRLADKVHVKSPLTEDALEMRVAQLEAKLADLTSRVNAQLPLS